MKSSILVDTGVIIEYLKTGKGLLPKVYETYTMFISASTLSELLASKTFEDTSLEKEVLEFVDKYFAIKDVDKKTAHQAAIFVRKYGINLSESLIMATAKINNLPFLTTDEELKKIGEVEFLSI